MIHDSKLEQIIGTVFNVQRFSVHDGSGIRTTFFLKGCPLRCYWCCNPESQSAVPQISRQTAHCFGAEKCGKCIEVCPYGSLSKQGNAVVWNPAACRNCKKCAEVCHSGCIETIGKKMTAGEAMRMARQDALFYAHSDGGITLSGGEMLMQPQFAEAVCRLANRDGIHAAAETCAYAEYTVLYGVARYLDEMIVDVKHIDSEKHRKGTGADNALILSNIVRLSEDMPNLPLLVRTPVIPGFNDDEQTISRIAEFVGKLKRASYELLPYHRLGEEKYKNLGRGYLLSGVTSPMEERIGVLRRTASQYVNVVSASGR